MQCDRMRLDVSDGINYPFS